MEQKEFRWIFLFAWLATVLAEKQFDPCGGKAADVYFVLDASGSIEKPDFFKELSFTEDVASMFDLNQVKVGLIGFSNTAVPQFGLGEYTDRLNLLQKISRLSHLSGGTNTAEALSYLYEKGMSSEKTRPDIPHIAIVLTDGQSQDPKSTKAKAKLLHDAGISVFVIGIGNQVDKDELENIGSKPSKQYVFMIDDFDALSYIREELAVKACEVKPATPAPNIQNTAAEVDMELATYGRCVPRKSLDIVFAVDTAAVGASNTKFILQFIANISSRIGMGVSQTTISTINNGCSGGNIDSEPAADSLMVKESLASYSAPHFYDLLRNMRLKAADGRRESSHIGIVFAIDRLSPSEFRKAMLESMRAKFQKTAVFVLGVGHRVDPSQYKVLIGNGGQFITVDDFGTLEKLDNEILKDLCTFGIN
ncbi:collagen [Mactra antiquata]